MNNLVRVVLAGVVAATAVPTFAQSDFSISLSAVVGTRPANRVAVGETVTYEVSLRGVGEVSADEVAIELDVPGVITNIIEGPALSCTDTDPVRCTLLDFVEHQWYLHVDVFIDSPGIHTATARVIQQDGTPDSNPSNDVATHALEAVALPALTVHSGSFLAVLEPGQLATVNLSVSNLAATLATNVVLTASLTAGGTMVSAQPNLSNASCTVANSDLRCTVASLPQHRHLTVDVSFTAPSRTDGEPLVMEIATTSAEEDFDPTDNTRRQIVPMFQELVVANVNDEGSGSLRQAIHDINALCPAYRPCSITFRIPAPVPEQGWFTIQPRTPLPMITGGSLRIDGRKQTLFTGDTNPDGPEIEINGALVYEQSGLRVQPNCTSVLRNLTVNGFPGYGIEVRGIGLMNDQCITGRQPAVFIIENFLGTDPRGRMAKPNQRGVGLFANEASVYDNVISGNRRAGIYIEDGGYQDIHHNRIGIGTDGSPLGNGAGIFVNMGAADYWDFLGADITENVIAHNHGMAIARTRRGEIFISKNSIFDNLQQGIDVGIDGPTAQRSDDVDVPNAPVLFSATYDPVQNATIVRGRIDSETSSNSRIIEIFASSRLSGWATPQAEQFVGTATDVRDGHQNFEAVVPGDLRGKWITATYSVLRFVGWARNPGGIGAELHRAAQPGDTSELSVAVAVQ